LNITLLGDRGVTKNGTNIKFRQEAKIRLWINQIVQNMAKTLWNWTLLCHKEKHNKS